MAKIPFLLSFLLIAAGLVGIVRGRIDRRWFTSRATALLPLALGLLLLFLTSAPPLGAAGRVPSPIKAPLPADAVLSYLEPIVRAGTEPRRPCFPRSKALFPTGNARFSRHTGKPTVLWPKCPKCSTP